VPAKLSPSRTEYVVSLTDGSPDSMADRLGARGSIEPIKGRSDLGLIRMRDAVGGDPRKAWKEAQDAVGREAGVQPVLLDADGQPQYPTGEVSVRFRERPSDAELERFARAHALRFLRRNEFVPEQAVFEPVEKARYLPDLTEELDASTDVKLAWANTIAAYDRAK
jgi:hypothetical protein